MYCDVMYCDVIKKVYYVLNIVTFFAPPVPVQYSTVQYSAVQCSAVQCNTVQYSAIQCSTVQYSEGVMDHTPLYSFSVHTAPHCIYAELASRFCSSLHSCLWPLFHAANWHSCRTHTHTHTHNTIVQMDSEKVTMRNTMHTLQFTHTHTHSRTREQYLATRHLEQSSKLLIFCSPSVCFSAATVRAVLTQPGAQHLDTSLSNFPIHNNTVVRVSE